MKLRKKHIACIAAACLLLAAVGVSAAIAQTSGKKQPTAAKTALNSFMATANTDTSSIAAMSSSVTSKTQAPSMTSALQRPSAGKAGDNAQISSSAHPAAVSRQSAVSKETTSAPETVKTITIQGKTYTANLRKDNSNNSTSANSPRLNQRIKFDSGNDSTFEYDGANGNLIGFVFTPNSKRNNTVLTKEQEVSKALAFIKSQKELSYLANKLSDYTLDECKNNDDGEEVICYMCFSRHMLGYPTRESFAIALEMDGKAESFAYRSGYFENVKLPAKLDESPYLAKLKTEIQSTAKDGTLPEYSIDSRCLYVSNSNQLGIGYLITIKSKYESGYGYDITLD